MNASILALKDGKPSLDLIEPRRPRRVEMEVDVWMFLEPAIALLMGVEIIEDDVQRAIRKAVTAVTRPLPGTHALQPEQAAPSTVQYATWRARPHIRGGCR